jgi:hypothetical protein
MDRGVTRRIRILLATDFFDDWAAATFLLLAGGSAFLDGGTFSVLNESAVAMRSLSASSCNFTADFGAVNMCR